MKHQYSKPNTITYGFHSTPFGEILVALSMRGVCHISFVDNQDYDTALDTLDELWPEETLVENPEKTKEIIEPFFDRMKSGAPYELHLKGTDFQIAVWDAVLAIPSGSTVSYQHIAHAIGKPKAARAVGRAVAQNCIALLIPCHRVITHAGTIHKYRWGHERKKALLDWEAQHTQS